MQYYLTLQHEMVNTFFNIVFSIVYILLGLSKGFFCLYCRGALLNCSLLFLNFVPFVDSKAVLSCFTSLRCQRYCSCTEHVQISLCSSNTECTQNDTCLAILRTGRMTLYIQGTEIQGIAVRLLYMIKYYSTVY
jgi:hypothetical protein